jgi:hypothetical protein
MLARFENLAREANGVFDAFDGSNSAGLEACAVHKDGIELDATIAIQVRAGASVECYVVFKHNDGGFDRVHGRATACEDFATGFKSVTNARAAIGNRGDRNVPCAAMNNQGEFRGIHVRTRGPGR